MLTFLQQTVHHVLFMDPQISLFSNFFIKNGSHGTIYTFKNYFATVISAISFQFQQNKSYPNRPLVLVWIHVCVLNPSAFCVFVLFFFFFTRFGKTRLLFMYCSMNSNRKCWLFSVNSASVHCSQTHKFHFLSIFSLKMGPTVLFTHLKIILLQWFQQ